MSGKFGIVNENLNFAWQMDLVFLLQLNSNTFVENLFSQQNKENFH